MDVVFVNTRATRPAKKKTYSNESVLSAAIVKKLNKIPGVECQKLIASVFGGAVLDIVGSKDGRFFWLEVKQPGRKPTDRQFSTMKTWIDSGAIATWTDSVDGAIRFIASDFGALTKDKQLEGFL